MKIPKTFYKNNHKYIFIKKYNDKVFLYKSDLGYKEAFDLYELGLINNSKIDQKINRRTWNNYKYIIYDRLLEEEKEYHDVHKIAVDLNVSYEKVRKNIKNHTWLDDRWLIERRYI